MKKTLSLLLALLLVVGLAGCGGKAPGNVPAVEPGTESGELSGKVVVWSWDVAAKALEDAAVRFKELHPDVVIEIEDLGTDQVYDRLLTRLASKTGLPDVVTMEGERVATFASKFPDGFADLTSVVNAADFLPVKIAEVTANGKVVGFPWDGAPTALYYRTDLFEQAGINADDIVTWDDFIEAGKKMDAIGYKMMPLSASTNPTFFGMLYQQTGTYFFDLDGNTTVNSKEGIRAATMLKKMYDAGITYDNKDWDGLVTATKESKIATVPSAVWWVGTMIDEVPESAGKWKVMSLPKFEEGMDFVAVNGGSNVLVPQDAPNKATAIEFAKFAMTDIESQINGFTNYGLYPSYTPSYTDPAFEEELDYFGGQKVWKFFAEISGNIPKVNYTENFDEAYDQIRDAQSRILLNDAGIEETLNTLQEKFEGSFGK